MSEPRKDVKVYFDPEVHAALKLICGSKDVGLAEYIESIVAPLVRTTVRDVMVLADEFRRAGISRDDPGSAATDTTTVPSAPYGVPVAAPRRATR